jgi:nucleotidyltransferase/DNA polymerase involved in DNA repair
LSVPRSILHVDMDQFYAAVEMQRQPELKGKPVIIGSDPKQGTARGVVSTASYEARAFGVRSAMPISTAWKLCPQGVFLDVDMPAYAAVSDQIHLVFEMLTPDVEPLSLDEAFLDVSASALLFGDGEACAKRVKAEILARTGLTCSVGVAANKFVAKVASELQKPDGLVLVPEGGEQAFLAPLAIGRLWGVGKVAEAQFLKLGVKRIGDLLLIDQRLLRASFGDGYTEHVLALAQGLDARPVESEQRAKSIGRECTFDEDTRDLGLLRQTLADLAEDVAARLRRHGWSAGQLTLKFRWEGFETHTRQSALRPATAHGPELFALARQLLKEELKADGRKVRLIGLSAGKMADGGLPPQAELFGTSQERQQALDSALDKIHDRFGDETLKRGNQSLDAPNRTRTGFSPD